MEPINGAKQETLMKVGRGLRSRGFMMYKNIKTIMHNACEESLKVREAYDVERKINLKNNLGKWSKKMGDNCINSQVWRFKCRNLNNR